MTRSGWRCYARHSDGKSMRWQRGDYGYVDESVDLGLNRLHYRRDFKQQVVEETGQLQLVS
jgi:hypothetical protein